MEKQTRKSKPRVDLTGKKFGHLTVLKRAPKEFRGAYWWCICDCPEHNIISCYSSHLTTG